VRRAEREEITGSLDPAKALQLGFEVAGRLSRIRVGRGAMVAQGEVIAELDQEAVLAQVRQAEAALRAAEAQAEMARDAAQRQERLQEGGSASEWQARSSASQARAAEAQVQVLEAALLQARALLAKHTLRAPFTATVIQAPDQIGAAVAPGAPLVTLEQVDVLTLRVALPEATRPALRPGTPVHVEAVGGRTLTDEARVRVVIPSADPTTRRVPVEITVPNRDGRFTAHTLARASLSLGEERRASALASSALVSAGGDHVFVVGPGGEARRLSVTVLDRGADRVVVQPLPDGARVIDSPAGDLADGTRVEVRG
jgi:RND family efflux transporter MFP subunit